MGWRTPPPCCGRRRGPGSVGAVRRGWVVRDARGRYALPGVDEARAQGERPVRRAGRGQCCAVPRLGAEAPSADPGWRCHETGTSIPTAVEESPSATSTLPAEDVSRLATVPGATVMACAARMPFDEALAVADSALRHRDVSRAELLRRAEAMPDRYRSRCLRVASPGRRSRRQPLRVRAPRHRPGGPRARGASRRCGSTRSAGPTSWTRRRDSSSRRTPSSSTVGGAAEGRRRALQRLRAWRAGGCCGSPGSTSCSSRVYVRRVLLAAVQPLGRALEDAGRRRSA